MKKHARLLKSYRKSKGLTQVQMAKKLGCAQSSVSHIEAGKREAGALGDKIEKVCKKRAA